MVRRSGSVPSALAPAFVRYWTKADIARFWPGTVCPLLTDTVEKGLALIGEQ
jgi:hypothetical protein